MILVKILVFIGFCSGAFGAAVTKPPYYGQRYYLLATPRAILIDDSGDLLVNSLGSDSIYALYEVNNEDGTVDVVGTQIVEDTSELDLTHGLAYRNGYLYASSSTRVFRWIYEAGSRAAITTPVQLVVENMPPLGNHRARTMVFDHNGLLYVTIGSAGNVDNDSYRARVVRFNLTKYEEDGIPIRFDDGETFADGLRNENGLAFDLTGLLWGVENGADNLHRDDLGGDIHNGNPGEEMHRFDQPLGTHYGYPYCFTSYDLPGYPIGTQFVWPSFMDAGTHDDTWCRNETNNYPPTYVFPSHQAPLGIEFYGNSNCDSGPGAFPCSAVGDPFVAFHGSWNSDVKVGYKVTQYIMDDANKVPSGEEITIVAEENTVSCRRCFRPVNAVFDKKGHLFVSSDATNEIYRVYYNATPTAIRRMV